MENAAILRPEMIQTMNSGMPFACIAVHFDKKTNQAKVVYYPSAKLKARLSPKKSELDVLKFPNHEEHETRNIVLPNGEIKKIRTRSIHFFNDKPVVW